MDTRMNEQLKSDVGRRPADLEAEADRARTHMEQTLDELERRLSPGQLLDQALRMVRDNGGGFGRNLGVQVRNNPVPVLLTGVGVSWLMMASDRPPQHVERTGDTTHHAADKARSAAGTARGVAGDMAEAGRSAGRRASDTAGAVRDSAGRVAAGAGSALSGIAGRSRDTAHGLQDVYRRGSSQFDYLRREQPLVLGALAVAAGAAIGALLPRTRREDEWLGEQSDDATDRLKEEGKRRAESLSERAQETAADAAAEAVREAGKPKRSDAHRSDAHASSPSGSAPSPGGE